MRKAGESPTSSSLSTSTTILLVSVVAGLVLVLSIAAVIIKAYPSAASSEPVVTLETTGAQLTWQTLCETFGCRVKTLHKHTVPEQAADLELAYAQIKDATLDITQGDFVLFAFETSELLEVSCTCKAYIIQLSLLPAAFFPL